MGFTFLSVVLAFGLTPCAIAAKSFPEHQTVLVNRNNQGDTQMLVEQNRVIALRFAQDGWGTKPNWRRVWDELMAADVIYHFNSSAESIVGLKKTKNSMLIYFKDFQTCIK